MSEVAENSIFSNSILPSEEGCSSFLADVQIAAYHFQPILTMVAPSFLSLESSPVRLSSSLLPKQAMCFPTSLHLSSCSRLLECPSHSPPVHMLSRSQDDNTQAKQELLRSSRRWSQLEYKAKERLVKMTQRLVLEGAWMPKQPVEECEPGEMSLQPGPHTTAQLIQKESSMETC